MFLKIQIPHKKGVFMGMQYRAETITVISDIKSYLLSQSETWLNQTMLKCNVFYSKYIY